MKENALIDRIVQLQARVDLTEAENDDLRKNNVTTGELKN